MPGKDQTGPLGEGSMTGRRLGLCTRKGTSSANRSENTITPEPKATDDFYYGPGRGRRSRNGFCNQGSGMGAGRRNGLGRQNRLRGGNQE